MADTWTEIQVAKKENRHEIVLSGQEVSKRIEEDGLDPTLFTLESLNFLEISRTCLSSLPAELCNLSNLTNLVLHGNKLATLPESVGQLSKLKHFDLSRNGLQNLPSEIGSLAELHSLNVNGNHLSSFPDVSGLSQLHILDVSENELVLLPDGISNPKLLFLAEIRANGNRLQELPADLRELHSLKTLDVADNDLLIVPAELSECPKLKEFKCLGNKLKDRRLGRMLAQCSTRAVMDYLRAILEKEKKAGGAGKSKDKKKGRKGKSGGDEMEDLTKNLMKVLHFHEEQGIKITVAENVLNVRQYIVCCIIRHINFNKDSNSFKRFLNFQTKLHDTVCKKRQFATIATHDLKAANAPLSYEARPPPAMVLTPLGKKTATTADKLVERLRKEADDFRKEKKRSTLSGIHQYLDLLEGKTLFPCLVDSKDTIISFPPITNCDVTKVSQDTTDILVEVTSTVNLDACKTVMDELLKGLLEIGIGSEQPSCGASGGDNGHAEASGGANAHGSENQVLTLEQARVVDHNGALKVVYPSRVDLQNAAYRVARD